LKFGRGSRTLTQIVILRAKFARQLWKCHLKYEIIPYSSFCQEKFYKFLVKFSKEKYTKRCAVIRATTFQNFSLVALALTIFSSMILKLISETALLIFSLLTSFSYKKYSKSNWMRFVEKKILYRLRPSGSRAIKCCRQTLQNTIKV